MCKKVILYGGILAAFGLGLLMGVMIKADFLQALIGIACMVLGAFMILK